MEFGLTYRVNNYIYAMKKGNIAKYCKLATVLLIDAMPVWVTIAVTNNGGDSDYLGFGLFIFGPLGRIF